MGELERGASLSELERGASLSASTLVLSLQIVV